MLPDPWYVKLMPMERYYARFCPNPKLGKYYEDFCQGRLGGTLLSTPARQLGQKIKVHIRVAADGMVYHEPCKLVGDLIVPCRSKRKN